MRSFEYIIRKKEGPESPGKRDGSVSLPYLLLKIPQTLLIVDPDITTDHPKS